MLQILGRENSSNVQKVLWCCGELGVPFEREDYGGKFGKTRDAEYLAMNPNATVPTIIDDDLVVWESNSIVRYLANKHDNGALYPKDPRERARCELWMDWQLSVLRDAIFPMFWGLVRTKPEDRDASAILASRQNTADGLAILDGYLGRTEFVGGSRFSIGDIPVGVFVYRWFKMDIEREELPKIIAGGTTSWVNALPTNST